MGKQLLSIFCMLIMIVPSATRAQSIERRFVNYTLEDGLSQSTISDIKQDNFGYTWLATADGVNVFDGSSFEVYKNKYNDTNSLSDNFVYAVLPFNDGTVWAITQGRMINEINVNTKKVKQIAPINELREDMYSAKQLLEDRLGNIWLSTYENGIIVLNREGKVVKKIDQASGLIQSDIVQFVHMGKEFTWVATASGLSKISQNLNQAEHYFKGRLISTVHSFRNKLFLSFYDSLKVTQSTIQNPTKIAKTVLEGEPIISIANQKDGALWLGSAENGLVEIRNSTTYYHKKDQKDHWSLLDNNIFTLFADNNDNVWIGTNSGLSIYKKAYNVFKLYRHNEQANSLSSSKVYDIYEDRAGSIWFVNYDGTLDRLKDNHFTTFQPRIKGSIGSIRIRSIHQVQNGTFYTGTNENGLFEFDPKSGNFKKLSTNEITLPQIKKIINFGENKILIAYGRGLATYNYASHQYKVYQLEVDVASYDLYLRKNELWVATFGNGLYQIKLGEKWSLKNYRHSNDPQSISSNNVMSIVPIGNDTLALGTYGGGISLFDIQSGTALNFTEADGLGNNSVYGIIQDQKKNLWLSTNKGISKWYANRKNVKNYDLPIQLQSLEFNEDAFLKSRNGTYFFGGVNGVNFFRPEEIIENTLTPHAVISHFKANDKEFDIRIAQIRNKSVQLKSQENYIQIYFNAMRYAVPEKTPFYYKLEGLENEWNTAVNENFVRYNNLSPGTYTFLLKACNEDGYCDEEVQKLTFIIATPFFKTFWFAGILVLAFFGIVFYIYRYRTKNLRKEYAAKMTNAELRALRIQMNPHFIFNSLNSIQYYVLNSDSKTTYKYLTKFSSLMRKTLQNSKENFLPIKEELESLGLYLELENMRLDNSLDISFKTDPAIDIERTLVPTLFMQPFVENAIIHGLLPKNGDRKIQISIEKMNQGIRCIIEDNGIGRNASRELNKKRNRSHQSTALTAIENRIKILNASANTNIRMEIVDLHKDNNSIGTRVILDVA